ncbi:MAG: Holliday junction branch migration protein RuvA [Nitrosomonas sp.]|nr:MAG: Holliday junction branch migration protein RuvA [Nitrosomonas sp.]
MIGWITGVLLEKNPPQILLNVQGIGYEIDVPMSTFCELPSVGSTISLHTHLVIREDMHQLFGFSKESERLMFRQLVKISGIGVRTGLALLSGMSVTELQLAIRQQQTAKLVRIPGIGKKTAERLLLELRDKLRLVDMNSADDIRQSEQLDDIQYALMSLGYKEQEVDWAMRQLPPHASVSDGIRYALQLLSKEKV